jgi:hypothetical protein
LLPRFWKKAFFAVTVGPFGWNVAIASARVAIYLQLGDNGRCRLRASVNIRKKPPHLLGMRDSTGTRGGGVICLQALPDSKFGSSGEQSR